MSNNITRLLILVIIAPLLTGCIFQDNVKKLVLSAKETKALSINYFKVTKIVDGDTIDVNYFGKIERIRMIGINTPESVDPRRPVECFGKEAAKEAANLLANKFVSLEADKTQDDRDKYGRMLRYVKTKDGIFYNLEIIKRGYAYEYTYKIPYANQAQFKKAQAGAQMKKLGLWADNACGLKNSTSTKAITTLSATTTKLTSGGLCLIKGNVSTNKNQKIYHLPDCPDYKKTEIDAMKGEKFFCNEKEALKAGFSKARNCK